MTWRSGRRVYVLKDVIIPAGTHGWEIDVHSPGERVAIFMPAACGNVSVVRTPLPVVAYHRVRAVVVPVAPAVVTAVAPPAPVIPDDTPAAPVVVAKTEFPPAPVAAHHALPLFLAPLLFGLAAFSGGAGPGPIVPVPVGCP
jgi:hypothetical protein